MIKKIDIHVHSRKEMKGALAAGVQRLNGGGTYATPNELRKMYDQIGVEKGVLFRATRRNALILSLQMKMPMKSRSSTPKHCRIGFATLTRKLAATALTLICHTF